MFVDKVTMAKADVSLAILFYPMTKLADALWKPSQQSLDARLRFYTELYNEGAKNSLLFIKDALKKGANPDIKIHRNVPLIVEAARLKLDKVVRALGDAGAKLNAKDKYGHTALVHSLYEGEQSTAQYLVDKGAKIEPRMVQAHGPTAISTLAKVAPRFNLKAAIEQDNAARKPAPVLKPEPLTANM